MNNETIAQCADELYESLKSREAIQPLTERFEDITIDDAYKISQAIVAKRISDGEKIVGKKIGITSKAVMKQLGVNQPDFGYITDKMVYSQGQDMPISESLMQPKAEGELAFILKHDLCGPGVTNADVMAATEYVMPCIEVVDSRVANWKIKIQDTVSDNASCGLVLLGDVAIDPRKVDLSTCGMVVEKNGEIISTGAGAAVMSNPVNAVAWLANTLGEYGISLLAGEVILSGSMVPFVDVEAGDNLTVSIGGVGQASVRFT